MRVLAFTSLFPNCANPELGIFIWQRITHLARRKDISVEVVAPIPYVPAFLAGTSYGKGAAIPPTEEIGGLLVHHPRYPLVPKVSMPAHGLLMYAGCRGYVQGLHRHHHFDCIDAHYVFPDGLAAVLFGKSVNVPVVVSGRGSDVHTFIAFPTIRPQIKWTLRQATEIVAVSESLAKLMFDLAGKRVQVIGNGVDGQRFFQEDQFAARKKLGLNPQDKIIVSVAALKPVKGPDLLVRAVALLRRSFPDCKVLFVGAGPELEALRQLAKRLDCAATCQFLGPVPNDQLKAYFSAADVSCLTSREEGWPNVILESLACGTPVVATAVGAVPQLLADPDLGIIVESTPEAICTGLSQALQQEWNRQVISAYAQRHTWENVAADVEVVLRRVVANSPRL